MLTAAKNLPSSRGNHAKFAVHLVTPNAEDSAVVREILGRTEWDVTWFRSARDAVEQFEISTPAVVLCERDLPDGTWRDMLEKVESMRNPPRLLVMSDCADENLWGEVLNLGGYDVLAKPLQSSEVERVLKMACRSWSDS